VTRSHVLNITLGPTTPAAKLLNHRIENLRNMIDKLDLTKKIGQNRRISAGLAQPLFHKRIFMRLQVIG
jgi:hypothetical protein